jgi:ABC-type branched-subunit amino acid transport system permease subunit
MDDPSRYHWWGEEPFPWIAVVVGVAVAAVAAPVLSWLAFELIDMDLEGFTP